MNEQIRIYVTGLLESYQKRSRQIELLSYELSHRTNITEDEMIVSLALGHGDGGGPSAGQISDKTPYVALNYRDKTDRANQSGRGEIANQLAELEGQQRRLNYYVSLLASRQAEILELLYFEGCSQEVCADKLGITTRTVRRLRNEAIDELAELYGFAGGFANNGCPGADR